MFENNKGARAHVMMCALNMRGRNANSNSSANSNYNSLSFPLPSRTHPLTISNSPQTNPNAPKPKTLAFKFHLPTFKTLTFDSNAWARIAILEPRRCCCPPLRIPRSVFSTLFLQFLVVLSNLEKTIISEFEVCVSDRGR